MFRLLLIDGHNLKHRSAKTNFYLTKIKKGSFKNVPPPPPPQKKIFLQFFVATSCISGPVYESHCRNEYWSPATPGYSPLQVILRLLWITFVWNVHLTSYLYFILILHISVSCQSKGIMCSMTVFNNTWENNFFSFCYVHLIISFVASFRPKF
jgi:hypothetical protein